MLDDSISTLVIFWNVLTSGQHKTVRDGETRLLAIMSIHDTCQMSDLLEPRWHTFMTLTDVFQCRNVSHVSWCLSISQRVEYIMV